MMTPILHLYAQHTNHDNASIIGTPDALRALRDAIEAALDMGVGLAESFTGDGEGYDLHVAAIDEADAGRLLVPYTEQVADPALRDERARGMGIDADTYIVLARAASIPGAAKLLPRFFADQSDTLRRFGLMVARQDDGSVWANVPHVSYHSPTGFEVGYAGSGPADLALAVMHALLPPTLTPEQQAAAAESEDENAAAQRDDPQAVSDALGPEGIHVSRLTQQMHQDFKRDFLQGMDKAGGYIPIRVIHEWIEAKTETKRSDR